MTPPGVRHRLADAADRSQAHAARYSLCVHGLDCSGTGPDCASALAEHLASLARPCPRCLDRHSPRLECPIRVLRAPWVSAGPIITTAAAESYGARVIAAIREEGRYLLG